MKPWQRNWNPNSARRCIGSRLSRFFGPEPAATPATLRHHRISRDERVADNFIPAVKSTSEFPLAPSVCEFKLSSWLGLLTDISFCSPWRFMA
jgi:hypothetical protein